MGMQFAEASRRFLSQRYRLQMHWIGARRGYSLFCVSSFSGHPIHLLCRFLDF